MLQEDYLKFDRMFDSVTIVFNERGRFLCEFPDDPRIRSCGSVRGRESLSRQAEAIWLSIVGSAQNDKRPVPVSIAKGAIGRTVRLPASERAHVRRGDSDQVAVLGASAAGHVFRKSPAERLHFGRVRRSGVRGGAGL